MIRIFATTFAGLLGLAFGSFLNVCLSRWPEGESVVEPRSHCRHCTHRLAWWENVPLLSWLALRGRCRGCKAWIGWRYPLVELAVGGLWAISTWHTLRGLDGGRGSSWPDLSGANISNFLLFIGAEMALCWLLVALAVLDFENLWLPDWLTLPGAALGLVFHLVNIGQQWILASPSAGPLSDGLVEVRHRLYTYSIKLFLGIFAAAGLILLIRWVYWLIRRREGIGLGDTKLMILLAAWLGLKLTLLAFCLGVLLGAIAALLLLVAPSARRGQESWAQNKLPLGTFLCIGGIVSSLWGGHLIKLYLRWAGF